MLGSITSYAPDISDHLGLLYCSTSSLLSGCFARILRSPDPHAAIHRFTIESITLLNNELTPQREHLYVEISDAERTESPDTSLFCIKCTASNDHDPEYFFEHSDSHKVLNVILSAVEATSPSSLVNPIPTSDSLVDPEPPSTDTSYRSVTTVTGQSKKNDRRGRVLRQIKPKGLHLSELALLADTVHKQDRLYSLFENQSYWYANLICNAVLAVYTCEQQHDARGATYCQDDVYIPPNVHVPGQCKRILVSEVESAMLSVVLARFEKARTQQTDAISSEIQRRADEVQKQAEKIQKRADYLEDLRQKIVNYSAHLDRIEEARRQQISGEVQISPDEAERQRQLERTLKEAQQICEKLLERLEKEPSQIDYVNRDY